MSTELYTIGDPIDFATICLANDGVTGIEPTETVPGVLDVTYEIFGLRNTTNLDFPAATAAITAVKPPNAIAGQVNHVLDVADLDQPLEGSDKLYIKATVMTTEGAKTFLRTLDVQAPAVDTRQASINVLTKEFVAGQLYNDVIYSITLPNGILFGDPVTENMGAVSERSYFIANGPNAGLHEFSGVDHFADSTNLFGIITATANEDDDTFGSTNDGTPMEALPGDKMIVRIRFEDVTEVVAIPYVAAPTPVVGAPIILG